MKLNHELVASITARAIEEGLKRGFNVSCAVVDEAGALPAFCVMPTPVGRRPSLRWARPAWPAPSKPARASCMRGCKKERPLYGTMLASYNARNDWMLAEGGAAIKLAAEAGENHGGAAIGAIGISGCFPATVDQEIADLLVDWVRSQV